MPKIEGKPIRKTTRKPRRPRQPRKPKTTVEAKATTAPEVVVEPTPTAPEVVVELPPAPAREPARPHAFNVRHIDPKLHTSYSAGGLTRMAGGQPFGIDKLRNAGQAARRGSKSWMASPGTAVALVKANKAARDAGLDGLRLTEVFRPIGILIKARKAYETWVRAGRPSPNTRHFNKSTMKAAFVAPLNGSNHQWGGAVDFDVYAMRFPGMDGDASLAKLWDIIIPLGFTPIIAHPNLGQSECWHFDYYGPLRAVYEMFRDHSDENPRYGKPYTLTAEVGCVLAGTHAGGNLSARMIQARLLIAGVWCGRADGVIGSMTLGGLAEVGLDVGNDSGQVNRRTPPAVIHAMLDDIDGGIGLNEIAEL